MTTYEVGFMRKCAEYGVDGRVLLGMRKKADGAGGGKTPDWWRPPTAEEKHEHAKSLWDDLGYKSEALRRTAYATKMEESPWYSTAMKRLQDAEGRYGINVSDWLRSHIFDPIELATRADSSAKGVESQGRGDRPAVWTGNPGDSVRVGYHRRPGDMITVR